MSRPFRFGVQISSLPTEGWVERLRRIEALGFSTLFVPDHFGTQWEPVATLAAAAAATERLKVGSLVYDVDYRHPVVLAKAAATTHLLSGGRHEFGIGAGWMETDYVEAGMTYDRPGLRISRLEEALQIIRSMWANERTSFDGEHYQINEIAQAAELPAGEAPPILIGGGGKRVLSIAGRYADIVGINPSLVEGKVTGDTARDLSPESVREKIGWVRAAAEKAGRDADALEFNSLAFVVGIADDVSGLRQGLAGNTGMTPEEVADCPLFLTGSPAELRDRLEKRREETGISYSVIQGQDLGVIEQFAEAVVEPLTGK
ncbi:MAG: TIGR03621 family F420-dependent LLM class oxidoreductase [Deltaproteobacteria bacterium]|nr:TIGR03621 family F420-dependent LLM class oxidoreductase [Deltaproteobacteria bacterium]MBW2447260.1 TIGR03621 family F420-dependent LLM class oxidoreductase [Deltaproteobacteria bacterium]